MDPIRIVEELERLNSIKKMDLDEVRAKRASFKYPHLDHYLNHIVYAGKPETATAELLKHFAEDIFKDESFSEVKIKTGFSDFVLQEKKINPIIIELKPGFSRTEDKHGNPNGIAANKLDYREHQRQVQKYLTANDYLILTDLRDSCLFSRDALVNYKPFYELSFTELLRMYLDNDCLWDNVRRLEDQHVKPELENAFFQDLRKWFDEFKPVRFKENGHLSKNELVVLLINKIIFIKTLEDYGLIPYKFLDDEYFSKVTKWEHKGDDFLFKYFFNELEDWFWQFYDTELFKNNFWDFLEQDLENLDTFRNVFERVVGFGRWEYVFGRGLIHYNYRKIDEDVFGKAYESFIASERKDSGIFYTHRLITQYMSERIVNSLFEPVVNEIIGCCENHDFVAAYEKMNEMYRITIADTASGSGSFLIKVFREIYKYYGQIYSRLEYVNHIHGMFEVPKHVTAAQDFIKKTRLNDRRKLISGIILRHIHAIDIDERAIDTAKTNLWKEAVKVEKSLFKYTQLGQRNNHILPNLGFNFHTADSLYDLPLQMQVQEISLYFRNEIIELHKLRRKYIEDPTHPELVDKIWNYEFPVRKYLSKIDEKIDKPALICLRFFYLFFDDEGNPLPTEEQGFSGIISNPPWEAIKPVKKEFAEISKNQIDVLEFDKWFSQKLKEDEQFKKDWQKYTGFYEQYSLYLKKNYQYQDAGDLNYYKLFIERDLQLIRKNGFLNILVPSGIQTDKGCSELRRLLLEENRLEELYSFENRGFHEKETDTSKTKIFPDVDNRFKFTVTCCQKKKPELNYAFKAKFYLHDPGDLYNDEHISVDKQMILRFSPENLSIMEFRHEKDYELCCKIRNGRKLFEEDGYRLRREFDMTNDSNLFHGENELPKDALPLFEGKMIHQYNSLYSEPRYWISEEEARNVLIGKEFFRIRQETELEKENIAEVFLERKFILDYETYRLAYRAIGSSTNERSLISSILPKNVFIGHSMNYLVNTDYLSEGEDSFIQKLLTEQDKVFLMALFNSLVLNYYIRNKISSNLTMNFIYELPIPEVNENQKDQIVHKAFQLLYQKSKDHLFDELGKNLGIKPEKEQDEIQTRVTLEVLIAKELFGLTKEEWEYLTSTFVYGDESESKKELDLIIAASIELY